MIQSSKQLICKSRFFSSICENELLNRPIRSILFTPGSNAKALKKAEKLRADGLMLDLEDAVSPNAKEIAREMVVSAVNTGNFGIKQVGIRINPLDSKWGEEDLAQVAKSRANFIIIPKVENAQMINDVAERLKQINAPESMTIWAMIETPLGVLNASQIASSNKKLTCLVAGTSDLTKSLRCKMTHDRHAVTTSLALIVLASRGYGLTCLDGVHLDLEDDEGFEFACRQGKEMGFDGKTLIHPKTIGLSNQIFGPTAEEVEHARLVVKSFEEALEKGDGVAVLNGKLIENLHYDEAQSLILKDERIRQLEASQ